MTLFAVSKTMTRVLTEDERKEVAAYIRANPKTGSVEIAAHFERVFKMPVTDHCILKIMVVMTLGSGGGYE